jgi:uncharacterized protein YllA (UPF0747 family)
MPGAILVLVFAQMRFANYVFNRQKKLRTFVKNENICRKQLCYLARRLARQIKKRDLATPRNLQIHI